MGAPKLSARGVAYAVRQLAKGRPAGEVGLEPGVSGRRVRQLYAGFARTGSVPELRPAGRPRSPVPERAARAAAAEYSRDPCGAVHLRARLAASGTATSCHAARAVMKELGMTVPSAAKSRRRRWVRYERAYSNALRHADWHMVKDPLEGAAPGRVSGRRAGVRHRRRHVRVCHV